jgi:hypothetical protein
LRFIHLKKDLQVKAKDWINCTDPQDSDDSELPLTKYGISKKAQESLAAVRTDLDSFSDAEARALMVRMTGFEIERSKLELDKSGRADWRFMEFDEPIARADPPARMLKLLSVAASLAFKIWGLSRVLRVCAISLAFALGGLLIWYCLANWNTPIVTIDFGEMDDDPWLLTWGYVALTAIAIVIINRVPAFMRAVLSLADYRKTAYEITVGVVMSILGWIVAGLHLCIFDKLYLWWGSQKRMLGGKDSQS